MSTDLPNGDEKGDSSDIELRELVYQALERDGLLTRLKAQLRAAVFKTIEKSSYSPDEHAPQAIPPSRTEQICRALVLNWLEQSNLLYTQDIFKVESSNLAATSIFPEKDLLEELHLSNATTKAQSILHLFIDKQSQSAHLSKLPESIKQSIDGKFPMEKLTDFTRLRDHFRSLFSPAFDPTILDTFLTKNLPSSSPSISKLDYEQLCLKWLQSCSKVLHPPRQASTMVPVHASNTPNGHLATTRARRSFSPPSESSSSSSSTSQSENVRKTPFDFPLPTTADSKKKLPNELERNHLPKLPVNGHKDLPIEYDDDESASQSIDDVTVDKASPSPSAQIDFFEDLE